MRHAMIMAGGAGTRLWPMSRKGTPKQLLPLIESEGGDAPRSLLEISAARLEGLVEPERRLICTGEAYRAQVREALPGFGEDQILGEPAARDTVNAVGFTAAVLAKQDPDAIFAVLTADHIIKPQDLFRDRLDLGFRLVEDDPTRLVTFSIKPTYPATGFGYVERGSPVLGVAESTESGTPLAYRVARFVEKPDKHRAQVYLQSGMFGWNSGMFVFHAGTLLSCLERFKPESHAGLMKIQDAWGTGHQQQVLDEVYPTLPKISVDYAIMEPASTDREVSVCTVMMDVDWLDVGSWPSFAETVSRDADGNRSAGRGDSVLHASTDSLVVNAQPGHTVAVLGASDLIVVHTKDATLVMPRSRAEDLKSLHERLGDELK